MSMLQAREVLNRCERLPGPRTGEQPRRCGFGASTAPGQGLLPELLTGFLQRCPDSRYVLLRGDSARIHSLMLESRVHLGFVGAAMDPRRFVYHPIANDRLVLIAPEPRALSHAPAAGCFRPDASDTAAAHPARTASARGSRWRTTCAAAASLPTACTPWQRSTRRRT